METENKNEEDYKWIVSAGQEYVLICTICGTVVENMKLHNETHEQYNY
jgi:uncharacterized Zn finger protein